MLTQKNISVVNLTVKREDVHRAQAALTASAVIQGLHALQLQRIEQTAIGGNRDVQVVARHLYAKGLGRKSPAAPQCIHEALARARVFGEVLHGAVDARVVADHDLRPPQPGGPDEARFAGGDRVVCAELEERSARAVGPW